MKVMNRPHEASAGCGESRRAPRYSIVAPVRFRVVGGEWLEGTTINIGRLGVLIRTESPPPPSTRLDFRIGLDGDAVAGAHVAGSGLVLRSDRVGEGAEALMAITIDDYQLRPAARDSENE